MERGCCYGDLYSVQVKIIHAEGQYRDEGMNNNSAPLYYEKIKPNFTSQLSIQLANLFRKIKYNYGG